MERGLATADYFVLYSNRRTFQYPGWQTVASQTFEFTRHGLPPFVATVHVLRAMQRQRHEGPTPSLSWYETMR